MIRSKMEQPFVSFIIPTWRKTTILKNCLSSIWKQNYPQDKMEVILVSQKKLGIRHKNTKTILVDRQVNHVAARNIGVKAAQGEILAFVDDDCFIPPNWLAIGLTFLQPKSIALIGGPILPPPNPKESFLARAGGYVMGSPFGTGFGGLRWKKGQKIKDASEIDLILANNLIKREIFDRIGGFDPHQVPCEENYLYNQVKNSGFKILYIPEIFVFHKAKPLFWPLSKKVFFYATGRGIYLSRFPNHLRLTFLAPTIFVLSLATAIPAVIFYPFLRTWFLFATATYLFFSFLNSLFVFWEYERNLLLFLIIPLGTFFVHLAYGAGFLNGIYSFASGKWKGGIWMKKVGD